jgi:hypothetical protein
MAINNWRIWEWIGFRKRRESIDVDADIDAIITYLKEVDGDANRLAKQFAELKKLRKDTSVIVDKNLKTDNLRKQIQLYDQLLLRYEYYTSDAEINAIRVKKIAQDFMSQAKKHKLYAETEKMRKESRWYFDW